MQEADRFHFNHPSTFGSLHLIMPLKIFLLYLLNLKMKTENKSIAS